MRRALRYAAAVLVLLFLLTGCGIRGGSPASSGGAGESRTAVPAEPASPSKAPARTPAPSPAPAPVPPEEAEAEPEDAGEAAAEPEEEIEEAPAEIRGRSPDTIVYVSKRSSTIHSIPDCCNMKHYREMTLADADASGYSYCSHCF